MIRCEYWKKGSFLHPERCCVVEFLAAADLLLLLVVPHKEMKEKKRIENERTVPYHIIHSFPFLISFEKWWYSIRYSIPFHSIPFHTIPFHTTNTNTNRLHPLYSSITSLLEHPHFRSNISTTDYIVVWVNRKRKEQEKRNNSFFVWLILQYYHCLVKCLHAAATTTDAEMLKCWCWCWCWCFRCRCRCRCRCQWMRSQYWWLFLLRWLRRRPY